MVKRVVSIEAGVWWTKVALADYRKKNPPVHKAFAFRTPEHAVEDGYIRDKEAFASALKAELSRHDIHEKEVVFTLSSSKVVTREVMIPFVKDNKIMGIIEAQIRDYFPMDVSNYTISYSKMDVEEEDGKKMLKLLLVAIPDNLLNNYVTFAELAGLKVETFDYIGNGTVQLLCDSFLENAVVVQLEEQATVISILENKKLVFQRVTPYGYGATITAVIDHPVLGIDDEEKALDFLLEHNVIYNRPTVPEMGNQEEMKRQQALAEEAYEDLAESLRYHLRIANTAVEYYQNQVKQEFVGNVYLVGDGSRFAGMHKLFAQELPLPLQEIDFTKVIDLRSGKNKAAEGTVTPDAASSGMRHPPAPQQRRQSTAGSRCTPRSRTRAARGSSDLSMNKPPSHGAEWLQGKEVFFVQTFYKICLILMIVGGINWGLVGLFQFDFVGWLLGGSASIWSRIVFTLVGLAALCGIPGLFTEETEK